jgi:hypothetical protein
MTKPINRFALVLWIFAVVLFISDVPATIAIKNMLKQARYPGESGWVGILISWQYIWTYVRAALTTLLQLLAFGVLIELVDQIRWNALPSEKRTPSIKFRPLWFLRNWPHSTGDE